MNIVLVLLIVYVVTSMIAALYISRQWFYSILNGSFAEREPRWIKILECYCIPTGIFFMLLYFLLNSMKKIISRHKRPKTELPLQMLGVFQENALAIEGVRPILIPKFIGVQVGEFALLPDSYSEVRPNDLRVIGPKTVLLVQGGPASLLVRLYQEGLSYDTFQDQLSHEDKIIIKRLASDLAGWIWPDVGEILRRKIEELGEDNILRALRNLFRGVEDTMRRVSL